MRRHGFLTLVAVLVVACGGQTNVSPPASSAATSAAPSAPTAATTTPVSDGEDAAALLAAGEAQAGQSLGNGDPDRDALIDALDLPTVLGADADHVLAVADAAEDAAAAKMPPLDPVFSPSARAEPGGRIIDAMAIFPSIRYLPPLDDARRQLTVRLDDIGGLGDNHAHDDSTVTARTSDGDVSATTDMRTDIDVTINGSDVRAVVDRDVHDVVTENKTGYTLLDHHIHFLVYGELDVCPSAKGNIKASSGHHYTSEANTFPASGGAVGSHNTSTLTSDSTFQGQVDDQANLTNVAQDAKVDGTFHRTASAPGGPDASQEGTFTTGVTGINDGVPVAHDDWGDQGEHRLGEGCSSACGSCVSHRRFLLSTAGLSLSSVRWNRTGSGSATFCPLLHLSESTFWVRKSSRMALKNTVFGHKTGAVSGLQMEERWQVMGSPRSMMRASNRRF